jgi:hypothetical protein
MIYNPVVIFLIPVYFLLLLLFTLELLYLLSYSKKYFKAHQLIKLRIQAVLYSQIVTIL